MNFEYETKRLVLKVCYEDMAEQVLDFYQYNKDFFDKYEMTRADNFYTLPYQQATLKVEYNEMIKRRMIRFYIFKKDEVADINKDYEVFNELDIIRKRIVGSVSLTQIRPGAFRDALFGYKLDNRYWGQGYASEACIKLMEIAFDELHLHKLNAMIMPDNERSIKVVERLGFKKEALLREACEVNKRFEDHVLYSFVKGLDDV